MRSTVKPNFRMLREAQGIDQDIVLAEKSGVARHIIQACHRGAVPDLAHVLKLATFFHCRPKDVVKAIKRSGEQKGDEELGKVERAEIPLEDSNGQA